VREYEDDEEEYDLATTIKATTRSIRTYVYPKKDLTKTTAGLLTGILPDILAVKRKEGGGAVGSCRSQEGSSKLPYREGGEKRRVKGGGEKNLAKGFIITYVADLLGKNLLKEEVRTNQPFFSRNYKGQESLPRIGLTGSLQMTDLQKKGEEPARDFSQEKKSVPWMPRREGWMDRKRNGRQDLHSGANSQGAIRPPY